MRRGFTVLELMIVLAIAGTLATLAIPAFQNMVHNFRGMEASRAALAAINEARGLAQRTNAPVQLRFEQKQVVLSVATLPPNSAESVRKTVSSYTDKRVVALPSDIRILRLELLAANGTVASTYAPGSVDAKIIFCASSDSYFRTAAGTPVCSAGNLISSDARVVLKAVDGNHNVRANAALGTLDVKAGDT